MCGIVPSPQYNKKKTSLHTQSYDKRENRNRERIESHEKRDRECQSIWLLALEFPSGKHMRTMFVDGNSVWKMLKTTAVVAAAAYNAAAVYPLFVHVSRQAELSIVLLAWGDGRLTVSHQSFTATFLLGEHSVCRSIRLPNSIGQQRKVKSHSKDIFIKG